MISVQGSTDHLIAFQADELKGACDAPKGTANHVEHTAGGTNNTGHPSESPI